MFYKLAQKALFIADPETAHLLALESLKLAYTTGAIRLLRRARSLPVECMGIRFANPVGLAAGLDKNGDYINALASLGFGFIEIGSVLPRPQEGNPRPRIFRLPDAKAIINRLGFNSKGVDYTVERLEQTEFEGILGINLGKNRDTPAALAKDDYCLCMEKVYPHADYVAINISSPNTPGLRGLQESQALTALLMALGKKRSELEDHHGRKVPLVVKVSPDLDGDQVREMASLFDEFRIDGVIATNTTASRVGVEGLRYGDEEGGLSGAPLKAPADRTLERFHSFLPSHIARIGLGGITCGGDAADKKKCGADLVQFYTGMVYQGPDLIHDCVDALAEGLEL